MTEVAREWVQEQLVAATAEVAGILRGLPFWADGGTLLGAVRSQGFIPWDDDVDLCLPRPAFARAMQLLQRDLPAGLRLLDSRRQRLSVSAKVVVEGLLGYDELGRADALSVDLTIMDQVSPHAGRAGVSLRLSRALSARYAWQAHRDQRREQSLLSAMRWYLIGMTPRSVASVTQSALRQMNRGRVPAQFGYAFGSECSTVLFPVESLVPLSRVTFGGLVLPAPGDPHLYLSALYGPDYLTPPEHPASHYVRYTARP